MKVQPNASREAAADVTAGSRAEAGSQVVFCFFVVDVIVHPSSAIVLVASTEKKNSRATRGCARDIDPHRAIKLHPRAPRDHTRPPAARASRVESVTCEFFLTRN